MKRTITLPLGMLEVWQHRDIVALGTSRFSNEYFVADVRKEATDAE